MPLVKEIQKSESLTTAIYVTGQRREMLQQVLDIFGVVPVYDLEVKRPGQDLYDITSAVQEAVAAKLSGCDRIRPVDPMAVDAFHNLPVRSFLILTTATASRRRPPPWAYTRW